MKTTRFIFVILFIIHFAAFAQELNLNIRISNSGHSLIDERGKPFFWLGDTAWELFHRLTIEEIAYYLNDRKDKGFNVIQCVILTELDGLRVPNRYGHVPLINNDPTRLNEDYFKLIDTVVKMAAERGMYLAILPTWGDKITLKYTGKGPVIFDKENAFIYGELLGKRYKRCNNIFWILGGDRPPADSAESWLPVYAAMAKGLDTGSEKRTLKSFHPGGFTWESSVMLHQEPWMDFNMIQSGHTKLDIPVWKMIGTDWNLSPVKPTIDAEPCYEDHPINPWNGWDPSKGYFRDKQVRRQLYRSVFAGAFGVTYGHHSIWQFYGNQHEPINYPDRDWKAALDRPGAYQAGYLKKLILSKPSIDRVPTQSLILNQDYSENRNYMVAFTDRNKTYAMVYLPNNSVVTLDMKVFPSKEIRYSWFVPETGEIVQSQKIEVMEVLDFKTPEGGSDWVLIIDKVH